VLDFDPTSGATRTTSADRLLRHIEAQGLILEWILDTHPHADHFSAADYLKGVTGAHTAIGERVTEVQKIWKKLYNLPEAFPTDGSGARVGEGRPRRPDRNAHRRSTGAPRRGKQAQASHIAAIGPQSVVARGEAVVDEPAFPCTGL
jgi:glyoxylase-like metal-dependent hydrolase (beta-lactamase superfamily II)